MYCNLVLHVHVLHTEIESPFIHYTDWKELHVGHLPCDGDIHCIHCMHGRYMYM